MFLNAGVFLIQTVFDLYIYVVILRFLLQSIISILHQTYPTNC
jgi:hypothetical protein